MKKEVYKKPQIKRKRIKVHFLRRNQYSPNADMDVILLAQSSGGGGACILPTTQITLSDLTQVSVESIKEGDSILSYDNKERKYVPNKVKKVAVHKNAITEYFKINKKLEITENHLLLVDETEWKRVKDLCIGDVLHTYKNQPERITILELISKEAPVVYNLELENEPGNYIADGICIHW